MDLKTGDENARHQVGGLGAFRVTYVLARVRARTGAKLDRSRDDAERVAQQCCKEREATLRQ